MSEGFTRRPAPLLRSEPPLTPFPVPAANIMRSPCLWRACEQPLWRQHAGIWRTQQHARLWGLWRIQHAGFWCSQRGLSVRRRQ
jgi:hypothetical protein